MRRSRHTTIAIASTLLLGVAACGGSSSAHAKTCWKVAINSWVTTAGHQDIPQGQDPSQVDTALAQLVVDAAAIYAKSGAKGLASNSNSIGPDTVSFVESTTKRCGKYPYG